MAVRLYIPDTIFFNFHTLYVSQVVLIFFSIMIVASFVWFVMALSSKNCEIEPFLFEDCASTFISWFSHFSPGYYKSF